MQRAEVMSARGDVQVAQAIVEVQPAQVLSGLRMVGVYPWQVEPQHYIDGVGTTLNLAGIKRPTQLPKLVYTHA